MKRLALYVSSILTAAAVITGITAVPVSADNPICQTAFTPDPAPMVYEDTLYVYTGRDRDGNNDFYYMDGYQVFSTTDMQNWTNHGCIMDKSVFSWAKEDSLWASQCIERNGKFYWYITAENASGGGRVIGVAVGDSPTGPFKDAIGKPLVGPNWDYIDPTVMIDDDGQAWLMFGNPTCYYVKLKEDMITLDGDIKKFDMTKEAFGPSSKKTSSYGEGPWITKRGNLYYLVYAAFYGSDGGESMGYSTAPSITGPWTYGGQIMKPHNCFTTHGGIIDYKDHSYFFYHKVGIPGGGTFNRSAAVEEFSFNADGSIPLLTMTDEGPEQLEYLNPYRRVEAETICWSEGVKVERNNDGSGACIGYIEPGDYIKLKGVDFREGAETFTVSAASDTSGGKIELHLDSKTGPVVGTVTVSGTGGWQKWEEVSGTVKGAEGVHDLYLVFNGDSDFLFNVDWWQFGSSMVSDLPDDPGDDNGYIFNSTFEKGSDSWTGRGGASVSVTSDNAYSGTKALSVSGRGAAWNGAQKVLSSSKFKAGEKYAFSVNFGSKAAKDVIEYKLTLQYTDADGEVCYGNIAQTFANPGEYVQLYNPDYKIPDGATNLYLIAETTEETCDFCIDDAIAAPAGTVIEGSKSDAVSPTDIKGDIDMDSRISVADLVLMKNGILSGFKSNSAKNNADVDNSTETNAADALYLQKYLLGVLKEFPDNTPPEPEKPAFNYSANLAFKEAPGSYLNPINNGGKVIKETYTGINGGNTLNVYLPAGYDSSRKYNIFYLMHGGGENENTIFSDDVKINYMLDNMIANGDIEPMIVVTPTFNKCTAETVWKEMKESIVPFVEGKYSTYAENTTPAGLEASRMHRAYGGFSMGGGSTWNVLINDIDYFAYLMPLSGHCWGGADAVYNAVKNSKYKDSTYILAATGTEDIAYGNMVPLINSLKSKTDVFKYTSDFSKGNFYFLEAPDKTHWWGFVRHYVYDALPYFFHE